MTQGEGRIDEAKGRAKEAAGALADDEDLRREGKADQASGKAKSKLNELVDKARDALKKATGRDDDDRQRPRAGGPRA